MVQIPVTYLWLYRSSFLVFLFVVIYILTEDGGSSLCVCGPAFLSMEI